MKHIFFTILTTVSVSACACAQPAQRPTTEQRAEQMTSQMSDRLSLTDKQREKVRKANLKFMNSTESTRPAGMNGGHRPPMGGQGGMHGGGMRGGGMDHGGMQGGGQPPMGGDRAERRPSSGERPQMQAPSETDQKVLDKALEKRDKSMRKILTDDQYARWREMESERQNAEFNRMPQQANPTE